MNEKVWNSKATELKAVIGKVDFKAVTFKYNENEVILKDINRMIDNNINSADYTFKTSTKLAKTSSRLFFIVNKFKTN